MASDPNVVINSALYTMRRLPPAKTEFNLSGLLNLLPEYTDELLQRVDQPLQVATDATTGQQYLLCDYNRDGRTDIASVNTNAPKLVLFRNEVTRAEGNNFIALRLVGGNHSNQAQHGLSSRDGYGARITLSCGARSFVEEHRCGEGYSAHTATDHIGAQDEVAIGIDSLAWPHRQMPPPGLAGYWVGLGHVLVAGQRVAHQNHVRLVGVELAVGLISHGEGAELDAAVKVQRRIVSKDHRGALKARTF